MSPIKLIEVGPSPRGSRRLGTGKNPINVHVFHEGSGTRRFRHLAMPNTKLETKKEFVQRAFGIYMVFRQWLAEYGTSAITVASCMGTIFSVSNTAACLPLSWFLGGSVVQR
jgi:hypothetical protein